MKRFTRVMCVILCILMTAALVSACGKKGESSSDDSSLSASEYSEEVLSKNDVNFAGADGKAAYRVVRPDEASNEETQAATLIYKTFKSNFDLRADNVTDKESGDGAAEILIGNTNRESTAKAKQLLMLDGTERSVEYIICTVDDDIVIYGMSDAATMTAAQYFVDNYMKETTVSGGINYFYNAAGEYSDIKLGDCERIGRFQIVRPIYNVSYLTQTETNKLIDKISEKTGYTLQLVRDQIASTDGSRTLTPTEAAEYEIIIGNCVRDGVNIISDKNTYEIRIEDKKVYLNGGSSHATAMAVSEFIRLVEGNDAITASMSVAEGDYKAAAANYDDAEYYKPTFWDDFDYTSDASFGIDTSKWDIDWNQKNWDDDIYEANPNGKESMRNSTELKNTRIEDGKLYIIGLETDTNYWGGIMTTTSTMWYRYGYIETSQIHPNGMGFWTCVWVRSLKGEFGNILPECKDKIVDFAINVNECYGPGDYIMGNTGIIPTKYGEEAFNLKAGEEPIKGKNNKLKSKDDRGFFMDFHTYGYEWIDSTHLAFTCDGDVFIAPENFGGEYGKLAYQNPGRISISMATGYVTWGDVTTDPEAWEKYNKLVTDYVYIYQKSGQEMYKFLNGKWTDVGVWNEH